MPCSLERTRKLAPQRGTPGRARGGAVCGVDVEGRSAEVRLPMGVLLIGEQRALEHEPSQPGCAEVESVRRLRDCAVTNREHACSSQRVGDCLSLWPACSSLMCCTAWWRLSRWLR